MRGLCTGSRVASQPAARLDGTSPSTSGGNHMRQAGPWLRAAEGAMLLGPDGVPAPTVFAEMSALAAATGAINLGQGFPDEDGPAEVLEAAVSAIRQGVNQYPPGRGIPEL